jgi:fucose permease
MLGFGAAINLALNNVYCAHTHPPSVILGLAHGSYGVGGIIAPIIGTAMASRGIVWSRFYFINVVVRVCCIVFAAWSFWSFKEDTEDNLLETTTTRQTATEEATSKLKNLKHALKNKVTIFGALFIFAYQGAEVSISGWFISYLISYRNGDPGRVGYVTAGFWVRAFSAYCKPCTDDYTGWYHTWTLRLDTRSAKDRREELCRHPYTRHCWSSTPGLVDTKLDR